MHFETATGPRRPLDFSPPVTISTLTRQGRRTFVAREDLLPGGTKQRAIAPYLEQLRDRGVERVVYASPFCGFAQVALAYVCAEMNMPCSIVAVRDPAPEGDDPRHEFTRLAESFGAALTLADDLAAAERAAVAIAEARTGIFKPPLGFDCPRFRALLARELRREWEYLLGRLPTRPSAVWLPVGSGTLGRIFSSFVARDIRLNAVDVHVLPPEDARLISLREHETLTYHSCPQPFCERALDPPNLPSNSFYDAKLWAFIAEHGRDGDVWWNVAR